MRNTDSGACLRNAAAAREEAKRARVRLAHVITGPRASTLCSDGDHTRQ